MRTSAQQPFLMHACSSRPRTSGLPRCTSPRSRLIRAPILAAVATLAAVALRATPLLPLSPICRSSAVAFNAGGCLPAPSRTTCGHAVIVQLKGSRHFLPSSSQGTLTRYRSHDTLVVTPGDAVGSNQPCKDSIDEDVRYTRLQGQAMTPGRTLGGVERPGKPALWSASSSQDLIAALPWPRRLSRILMRLARPAQQPHA